MLFRTINCFFPFAFSLVHKILHNNIFTHLCYFLGSYNKSLVLCVYNLIIILEFGFYEPPRTNRIAHINNNNLFAFMSTAARQFVDSKKPINFYMIKLLLPITEFFSLLLRWRLQWRKRRRLQRLRCPSSVSAIWIFAQIYRLANFAQNKCPISILWWKIIFF